MMLGLSLALTSPVVLRRASPVVPPWVPDGAAIVTDFANNRYWSQPMAVYSSFDAFVAGGHAEFTRESDAWWTRTLDPTLVDEFAPGALRRVDGDGALLLPSRERISRSPLGISNSPWTSVEIQSVTALDPIGSFPAPARIASNGIAYGGRQLNMIAVANGAAVSIKALYRQASSPNAGLTFAVAGNNSVLAGPVGALASTGAFAGPWSNIVNTSLGDGLYMIEATITPNATSSNASLTLGTRTTTAGHSIDYLAAQVVSGAGPSEWIFGSTSAGVVVAADEMTLIPPGAGAFDWMIIYDNDSTQTVSGHIGPLTINPTRPTIKTIVAEAA